jgi:phosphatidylglycerol:prolipoprotein diacylglycerol transferase
MRFPEIDPVFFSIGPLQLRWYGLMYILGFLAAYLLIRRDSARQGFDFNGDDVADLLTTLAVGVILGGRLGYVLFYNPAFYLREPLSILAIWEGGMSFHGGLVGVVVALIYFARKRGVSALGVADLCALSAPVGLGLGRLGNFINGELYGRVTTLPWGMVFPGGGDLPRHPSQLYQAFLEGVVIFVLLRLLSRPKFPAGTLAGAFLLLYGCCRILVEFVREPDAQLGLFGGMVSMGQLLSLPMMLAGGILVTAAWRRGKGSAGTV